MRCERVQEVVRSDKSLSCCSFTVVLGLAIHGAEESRMIMGIPMPWFCFRPHPSGVYFHDVLAYVVGTMLEQAMNEPLEMSPAPNFNIRSRSDRNPPGHGMLSAR